MIRILTLAALFLATMILTPLSADASSQRVTLAHESFTLPAYIAPVDVSTSKYGEFDCLPPDSCAVIVGFYTTDGALYQQQNLSTDFIVSDFIATMSPRYLAITGIANGDLLITNYQTATGIDGKRVRIIMYDTFFGGAVAVDWFMQYASNGDMRMITYVRPASWLSTANGNGLPIFQDMLDSLTLTA